jgi:hypothetical protein
MFVGDIHGGTLVYWKRLFDEGLRYPPCNIAEDAALIQSATRRGRRLTRVPNDDLFVYADTEGMRGASRRDIFLILRDGS